MAAYPGGMTQPAATPPTAVSTPPASNRQLITRALGAYVKAGNWNDLRMPVASVEVHDDLRYVVLRGHEGLAEGQVLAVYRLLPSGALKSLRRYPSAIAGIGGPGATAHVVQA